MLKSITSLQTEQEENKYKQRGSEEEHREEKTVRYEDQSVQPWISLKKSQLPLY